jgi:hypothetical protein
LERGCGTIGQRQPSTHPTSAAIGIEKQVPSGEVNNFDKRIDDCLITRVREGGNNTEGSRRAAGDRRGIEIRAYTFPTATRSFTTG